MTKADTPPTGERPCAACDRPSWYVSEANLFVHADGTDNRVCWDLLNLNPFGHCPTCGLAK